MMTDKILCPWCGAEMLVDAMSYYREGERVWEAYSCCSNGDCGAEGPKKECVKDREEAMRIVRAAALRRYTPPIKPMPLKEVWREDAPMWVEGKSGALWIGDFYASMDTRNAWEVQTFGSAKPRLLLEDYYNKNWRCWERKPTDEERSAAEWET